MTIADDFVERALARPDALAVSCAGDELTYGDLDRGSARLAGELRALGVGPDDVVGVLLGRSPAMIVSALAVLRAGAAYLPLDPSSPGRWTADVLQGADVSALIACGPATGASFVASHRLITVDRLGRIAERGDSRPAGDPVSPAGAGNLAYVIFTSGSTGQPKGVEVTHAGLSHLVRWHRENFAVSEADRATQVACVGFDAAAWEIWPYLASGASVHLPPGDLLADAEALRDWLVARQITISFAPTPMAERLLSVAWPSKARLRVLLSGGDTLHRHPPEGLPFTLYNNYGPTECAVVAMSCRVAPGPQGRDLPPIGRPIGDTRAYVLDGSLRPVSPGVPGELHLGGPGLARGYRNRPDLTRERFIRNPFGTDPSERIFKTGDFVRALPDGQLAFLGRKDDLLKIRGFRIEPGQVEAALGAHPSVAESAVVGRDLADGGKHLVAYLVPRQGARVSPSDLREFLGGRLPGYMVPSAFVALEVLPLTANGKVDRARLPEPGAANLLKEEDFAPPDTETEKAVAAILAPLLGIGQVDVNANFFSLGGHSLLGAQLIARLRSALGVSLPLRTVFEAPSVAALSLEIDRQLGAALEMAGASASGGLDSPSR